MHDIPKKEFTHPVTTIWNKLYTFPIVSCINKQILVLVSKVMVEGKYTTNFKIGDNLQ